MRKLLVLSAAAAALISASSAYADTMAVATRDVNVRAAPASSSDVIGRLGNGESVEINGCVQNGRWCSVAFDGGEGFVSSRYLAGDFDAGQMIIAEQPTASIRTTRPSSPATGTGALVGGAGAVIGGPIGAAVGGAAGVIAGGTTGAVLDPPRRVRTYVRSHRVEPVYLDDQVVVGSSLPDTVELRDIPDYQYRYVYVNDQPMLVDPGSRRIVYVEQ
jgi:hypothetical protein